MISSEDFGASFQAFMQQMATQQPAAEPPLRKRLTDHFGGDPAAFAVVKQTFERHDHPNLHLAIEAYLDHNDRSADMVGIAADHKSFMGIGLSQLVTTSAGGWFGSAGPSEGPVEYKNVSLDGDRVLACVQSGLYLIRDGKDALALLIGVDRQMGPWGKLHAEVMAPARESSERLIGALRALMRKKNVYRSHVISLEVDDQHALQVKFHRLPEVSRDGIILPDGLLKRIERQTVGFTNHAERLKAAGRHLKRGILLHGPPGTGKTLTAMYLSGALKDRTVLLVTGRGQGLIEQCCQMARVLEPSIVIVEDVDLIAEERTRSTCTTPLLFELLNQMDGLADDVDILFLLTSNRPGLLEPALAARPGRVDQAIEIPLPDETCRRRLIDLYGRGLNLEVDDWHGFIRRTEGASAAFIRELLRKAALFAADESAGHTAPGAAGDEIHVHTRHVEEAIHELLFEGGELTKSLLGYQSPTTG